LTQQGNNDDESSPSPLIRPLVLRGEAGGFCETLFACLRLLRLHDPLQNAELHGNWKGVEVRSGTGVRLKGGFKIHRDFESLHGIVVRQMRQAAGLLNVTSHTTLAR